MDVPIDGKVACADGFCGRITHAIIKLDDLQVTYVVVEESGAEHRERLVPFHLIQEGTPELIQLRCTAGELDKLEPFVQTRLVVAGDYSFSYSLGVYGLEPFIIPAPLMVPMQLKNLESGELPIRRGSRVKAKDGYVGKVYEFLVDPDNETITHLILKIGPFWSRKEIAIPVDQIDRVEETIVYLKMDKKSVQMLPPIETVNIKIPKP